MDKKEMRDKYRELFDKMAAGTNVEKMKLFGRVMSDMMEDLIETQPEKAEEYLEKLEAVKWRNYLTQKEAEKILAGMEPAAPWSYEQWKKAIEQYGYAMMEWPYYNSLAMWVVMCMIMSDSGTTIQKYVSSGNVFGFVHDVAMDKLKDKDEVFSIRKYFSL